jgi:hypothetical protein
MLTHEAEDGTSAPMLLVRPGTPPSAPSSGTPGSEFVARHVTRTEAQTALRKAVNYEWNRGYG